MRIAATVLSFAAFAFANAAAAQIVTLAPVSFSEAMQTSLEEDIGLREAERLQEAAHDVVAAALARRGATVGPNGDVTIEIEVVDAEPNRPTMQQLSNTPGLDAIRSISIGGAELRAVLRTADGRTVEVRDDYYDPTIEYASWRAGTWSAARVAMRRFANKVADAYAELS